MREFVFTIDYEEGIDPGMDLFISHSNLHARTMAIQATTDSMWRLDRITGSSSALDAYDAYHSNMDGDDGSDGVCGDVVREHTSEILAKSQTSRLVYTYRKVADPGRSIPYLAAKYIGDGLLMHAERRGQQYRWRFLLDDETAVGPMYDTVSEALPDGLSLRVQRLSEPECWIDKGIETPQEGLAPKQQAALEAAVEHGYYQTPREHTAQELSEKLDIPNSTLQYRLSRAEAWLANRFVSNALGAEPETQPEDVEVTL
ncbi:helix-turn-helix domain-containing protein [Halocatena halophila]|uniref:helix-turn-helix domain-containing protein n=1 Tax=Halocatena halophila TaxID=2814576 RepID=UPI002ED350CA